MTKANAKTAHFLFKSTYTDQPSAYHISKSDLITLLANHDGLTLYPGVNTDGKIALLPFAFDIGENDTRIDVIPELVNAILPCPSFCSEANEFNTIS